MSAGWSCPGWADCRLVTLRCVALRVPDFKSARRAGGTYRTSSDRAKLTANRVLPFERLTVDRRLLWSADPGVRRAARRTQGHPEIETVPWCVIPRARVNNVLERELRAPCSAPCSRRGRLTHSATCLPASSPERAFLRDHGTCGRAAVNFKCRPGQPSVLLTHECPPASFQTRRQLKSLVRLRAERDQPL